MWSKSALPFLLQVTVGQVASVLAREREVKAGAVGSKQHLADQYVPRERLAPSNVPLAVGDLRMSIGVESSTAVASRIRHLEDRSGTRAYKRSSVAKHFLPDAKWRAHSLFASRPHCPVDPNRETKGRNPQIVP